MNRKIPLFTLILLVVAATGAFAASEGEGLPTGAVEVDVYILDNGNWVKTSYARAWNSILADSDGFSNQAVHEFEIINHVSIAQWVKFHVSGTRKDWRVLRPGTYASNSVTASIQSNNDVIISFWADDPEYMESGGVTRTIPKSFAYSTDGIDQIDEDDWLDASDTSEENPAVITISDSADLHSGLTFKIWEKIVVVESNSSSEYEGRGWVTIKLTNIKHWVDGETGEFRSGGGTLDP